MKIGIIGVGNIGLRYVQGISRQVPTAEIFVVDRDSRLEELKAMDLGCTGYCSSLDDIPERMDLLVVATSCDLRFELYQRCLQLNPRYIVLEKYLFKSRNEFDQCLSIARVPTFVNQWMFGTKAFDSLFNEDVRSVVVRGSNWGLACNSVHWIDLFKRSLGISNLQVGKASSVLAVFGSKRAGYEEVYGDWSFEDIHADKMLRLIDSPNEAPVSGLTIEVDDKVYHFDYKALSRNGNVISHFPYLSDQIGGIVEELLKTGTCCLPNLEESVSQHLLVEEILDRQNFRPNIT